MATAADEDRVVAALDVQLCNTVLGDKTQLCLFQYPLRPRWRPYGFDDSSTLRIKPEARRVEMTVPLDTDNENYDSDAAPELQLQSLRLRSSPAALPASLAMATIRDGKLLLLPVSQAFSFRPDMSHLDPPPQPAKAEDKKEAAAAARESTAIQPQIQRRETERQARARLASYAHLSRQEAEEAWLPIQVAQPDIAPLLFRKLEGGPAEPLPMPLSRREYLEALLPTAGAERAGGAAGAAPAVKAEPGRQAADGAGPSTAAGASAATAVDAAAAAAAAPPLPPELAAALARSLGDMFRSHPVADLQGIRPDLLEALAAGPHTELQNAVLQSGLARLIRGVFVSAQTGSSDSDALRRVVLDTAARQASFRKAEVVAAAQAAGLAASEAQISRALRDVCQSKGAAWSLKRTYTGGLA